MFSTLLLLSQSLILLTSFVLSFSISFSLSFTFSLIHFHIICPSFSISLPLSPLSIPRFISRFLPLFLTFSSPTLFISFTLSPPLHLYSSALTLYTGSPTRRRYPGVVGLALSPDGHLGEVVQKLLLSLTDEVHVRVEVDGAAVPALNGKINKGYIPI
jgi:hypothetical protein